VAGLVIFLGACTNAPGTEEGGDERFDASASTSSTGGDGGCGAPTTAGDAGAGWGDLYADFFGPAAVSGCAGAVGQCHGESSGLGAQASDFVCAGGASGCYTGITASAAGLVTVGDTKDDPTTSTLYLTLRKSCGGGSMPKEPASFAFSAADMARITDWIGAGAPNN
jgi:hypothetical protein